MERVSVNENPITPASDAGNVFELTRTHKAKPNGKSHSFGDDWTHSSSDDWTRNPLLTAINTSKPRLANALTALSKAPELQDVPAYDEFALVGMMMQPPPWLRHQHNSSTPTPWTDRDALTANWLQDQGIAGKRDRGCSSGRDNGEGSHLPSC
jgi:hypothetical protein